MNPNKALWEKGDFTEIAALMRESGEAVAKSLGITTPLRVLDLGCGAAEKSGKVEELHYQLLELAKGHNTRTDGSSSIPATFLRVTVSL
jgi:ubiquinone/menaquinone biosynthesis C-methylase UbiE